jgi:hypothetical protein
MYSLQQSWRRGQNRFCLEARGSVKESEDINHLNRSIKHNEIEAAVESPEKEKSKT